MHVFQRGVAESLVIGADVTVTVLAVEIDCVRIGITDPRQTPAYREEVLYLALETAEDEVDPATADTQYELAVSTF